MTALRGLSLQREFPQALAGIVVRAGVLLAGFGSLTLFGPELGMTTCAIAILAVVARSGGDLALALALPIAARIGVSLGAFHFEPPDQIVDLAARNVDPVQLMLQNDIWWPRYLLSYPAVAAMDAWGMRLERSYALYITALLPAEIVIMNSVLRLRGELLRRTPLLALLLVVALSALVFAVASRMNGRLFLAHVGLATVLAVQCGALLRGRVGIVAWLSTATGLILGQMSSGAGAVVAAQVLVGWGIVALALPAARQEIVTGLLLISAVSGPFLYRAEAKNVTFFAGDPVGGMLRHGAGGLLLAAPAAALALVLGAVVFVVMNRRAVQEVGRRLPMLYWPVLIAIPIALGGGLFGYSTLTMVIPPILLVSLMGASYVHRIIAFSVAIDADPRAKRAVDVVLGAALLVATLPLIAVCALAVKFDSPGPAFYFARRVGRYGREFRQLKLRSMRVGADAAGFRTRQHDVRITRVGRFLRAMSLDELPQLWNVVRGEMSLVGPRPAAVGQIADYTADEARLRALVRPGVTGLSQVSGRSTLPLAESTSMDLWYVQNASLSVDWSILTRTIGVVLGRRGTN